MIHIDQQIFRLYNMNDKTLLLAYFNFTTKINCPNRKKTYNIDEKRVVNTNGLWIYQKYTFSWKLLQQ
jgi:hypothetical protein